ncbi:MAG: hypothetical protein HC925_07035 [Coleofasciculaceae cyanobacterium SM2_3_26]|nr:hypothetical protein [Coleofasciculaceae cyanobacterium SM2_3_26]
MRDLSQLADLLAQSFHTNTGIAGWFYPVFRLGIYEDLRLRLRSGALTTLAWWRSLKSFFPPAPSAAWWALWKWLVVPLTSGWAIAVLPYTCPIWR